jgi:hypothetical protein
MLEAMEKAANHHYKPTIANRRTQKNGLKFLKKITQTK